MKRVYRSRTKTDITPVVDIENCEIKPTSSNATIKTEDNTIELKKLKKGHDSVELDEIATSSCSTVTIDGRMGEQIRRIEQMRISGDAPVDTMGCHTLADKNASPKVYRFQVLVALMLSSQTKDHVTSAAMQRLRNYGLTIENIEKISKAELEQLLIPRKADYLKRVAIILKEKYDYDIPDTLQMLCSLPGVGPKMANLTLQVAWDKIEGIGVDTHVHRISNRLGWVKTKTPIDTEKRLMEILPKDHWTTINKLLVGFGQQTCLPVKPKCNLCLCRDICPASTANL